MVADYTWEGLWNFVDTGYQTAGKVERQGVFLRNFVMEKGEKPMYRIFIVEDDPDMCIRDSLVPLFCIIVKVSLNVNNRSTFISRAGG